MTKLIELNDQQSEVLCGGWSMATNTTTLTQRNAAANVALGLGGPAFVINGQFNSAIVGSLIG
jgi:hypothetical protein